MQNYSSLYPTPQKIVDCEMGELAKCEMGELKMDRISRLKKFENKKILDYETNIDFQHPFSCKLIGSRGAGKTTFMIHYLNTGVTNDYESITWITPTGQQEIFNSLENKHKIKFLTPDKTVIDTLCDEIDAYKQKRLIIFDDSMSEECIKSNRKIIEFYTKGRHKGISIFSLEQHISVSHNVEKGNTDYYLLFRVNDCESLDVFRKKFCGEYSLEDFIRIHSSCIDSNRPLIVSLSTIPKYRCNFNEEISLRRNVLTGDVEIKTSRIMLSTERLNQPARVEERKTLFDIFCVPIFKCLDCCFM